MIAGSAANEAQNSGERVLKKRARASGNAENEVEKMIGRVREKVISSLDFVDGVPGDPAQSRSFSWCLCGEFHL
jgi:hypothetical protein